MQKRFLVQGRVQGVGFRWFVRQGAGELGLSGWVRNTRDGAVEVLAEGSLAQLGELEVLLRRGPAGSNVTNLQVNDILEEVDGLIAFEIMS